ncbi:MAG: helix-turn-helix domain-containing protein [Clostridia bacterium]|nr:helix-turn-helix domain-containing protein [Clostridia bacterium]
MNLERLLDEFYSKLDYDPISSNAQAVYGILLQIARKTHFKKDFKVSNAILMAKTGLPKTTLQRARAELIENGYIEYSAGLNQNDASKYSIIDLTVCENEIKDEISEEKDFDSSMDNADDFNEYEDEDYFESADGSADGSAHGPIITKLNLLFNYINNNKCDLENLKIFNFNCLNIHRENRSGIINILKRLNCYVDNENVLDLMPEDKVFDLKIMYWAIKELYESPHRTLLQNLTEDKLKLRLLKSKKYMQNHSLNSFIKYFMKCLQNEIEAA